MKRWQFWLKEKKLTFLYQSSPFWQAVFRTLVLPSVARIKRHRQKAYLEFQKGQGCLRFLNIELTNHCNLHCRYCLLDDSRPKGFMSLSLFKKIIEEIIKNNPPIENIALYNAGESLLHPHLREFLKVLNEAKNTLPVFPSVGLSTNAVFLTPKIQKLILSCLAVDSISLSIDGGNQKTFENIRRGAHWPTVIKNAQNFLKLKNQLGSPIEVNLVSIFTRRPIYASEFKDLVLKVNHYWPIKPHNWDGSKRLSDLKPEKNLQPSFCNFIFDNLAILWDGRVSPCCNDQNGRGIIGDLNKQSLKEIYFGSRRREIIEKMAHNHRYAIKLCQNCNL